MSQNETFTQSISFKVLSAKTENRFVTGRTYLILEGVDRKGDMVSLAYPVDNFRLKDLDALYGRLILSSDPTAIQKAPYEPDPDQLWVLCQYLHDNGRVTRLTGNLPAILEQARIIAKESPGGMLCEPSLMEGVREIRRLPLVVHAHKELHDTYHWEKSVREDEQIKKLLDQNRTVKPQPTGIQPHPIAPCLKK